MSDLGRRTVTAAAYGAVVLVAIFAPQPAFLLLTVLIGVIAYLELGRLCLALGPRERAAALVVGGLYLGLGLASIAGLWSVGDAHTHHEFARSLPAWLLLALLPTWAADVVAYLAGRAFGRTRLAPRISPGKTWEGTLAGFAAAAVAVLGVAAFAGLPRLAAAIAAVTIGPVGLLGDLLESWLKRRAGAKDSGSMLPGHGGVLDRIDSLLAVAPLVLVLLIVARLMG